MTRTFLVKAEYITVKEIEVEAASAEEARDKFRSGDWDSEFDTDCYLHEIVDDPDDVSGV